MNNSRLGLFLVCLCTIVASLLLMLPHQVQSKSIEASSVNVELSPVKVSPNLTFAGSTVPLSSNPFNPAIGDFNHDGHADLAIPYRNISRIAIYLGRGDGTFSLSKHVSWSSSHGYVFGLEIADLNRDGYADLVIILQRGHVAVALGTGKGSFGIPTFTQTTTTPSSSFLYDLAVIDMDGDTNLDVAVVDYALNEVLVLKGNGLGGLAVTERYSSPKFGTGHVSIAIGDQNKDGILDILVGSEGDPKNYTDDRLTWLIRNGTGNVEVSDAIRPTFDATECINPTDLVLYDIDMDKTDEIIVSCGGTDMIFVLGWNGSTYAIKYFRRVTQDTNPNKSSNPMRLRVGDLDANGWVDIGVVHWYGASTDIFLNINSSASSAINLPNVGQSNGLIFEDLNHDTKLDLVMANFGGPSFQVFLQQ